MLSGVVLNNYGVYPLGRDVAGEEREFRRRVVDDYFPAWCAVRETRDASLFDPDWSFVPPGLARWFLIAANEGVIDVRDGCPTLPDGSRNALFENDRPRLFREGFLEVAAVGMLVQRFGWSPSNLTFQSPRPDATAKPWAFDILGYAHGRVALAAEAKWKQRDATKLVRALQTCGARGSHSEAECDQVANHHRKYDGLVAYRPRALWVIGPDAFAGEPDLVFRVTTAVGGVAELEAAVPAELEVSRITAIRRSMTA